MKHWRRLTGEAICGRCGERIPAGGPALVLTLQGVTRLKFRCPACAGEAAPELPAVVERAEPLAESWVALSAVAQGRDWKRAQSGEREPGEDG